MATKPKRPTYNTPKGVFKYPALTKPDYGNEQFPKPDGEFKTAIIIPLEAAQPLIDKLMPAWTEAIRLGEEAFAKLALPIRKKLGSLKEQMFYETEYDPETEEPTGNVIFKVKTKYRITDSKTKEVRYNSIGLFDAKGKPLPKTTAIYGGTVGIVAFQTRDYFVAGQGMAGLSLQLSGAQVIELVGPGARSASSMGFAAQDGYEAGDDDGLPADDSAGPAEDDTDSRGPRDF